MRTRMRLQMRARNQLSCFVCGKGATAAYNRPKSLHKTKRVVYPNLVTFGGAKICTRCLRSLRPRQAKVAA